MAALVTRTCDVCGAVKREANHWFILEKMKGGYLVLPAEAGDAYVGVLDLCSEDCLQKKESELRGTWRASA